MSKSHTHEIMGLLYLIALMVTPLTDNPSLPMKIMTGLFLTWCAVGVVAHFAISIAAGWKER